MNPALQLLSVSIFPNRSRGKIGKSVCAVGTPPDFVPATSTLGSRVEPWSCLPRIESSGRFSGSLLARKREHSRSNFMFCQSCDVERGASETNPFRHFTLRNANSPEGNSRPHRSTVKKSLPRYPLLTSPACPAMMVSYQTVDGLNSWPAKQMGEKQDEREIQKKL